MNYSVINKNLVETESCDQNAWVHIKYAGIGTLIWNHSQFSQASRFGSYLDFGVYVLLASFMSVSHQLLRTMRFSQYPGYTP
jgi:hypothetical protein